jgi:hypothetical protein
MDIYWNIFTMHASMNVKSPNNTSKWQTEFNSAFKGLMWNFRKWNGGMDWIDLAQDRDRWQAVVNSAMNRRVL